MANENENQGGTEGRENEFDSEKSSETGAQSQQPETGQQGSIGGQQGQQSEFGQQGQATSVADRTGQQAEMGQQGEAGQKGETGQQGSGFVGSQGENSDEYLQEGSTGQDFAEQGRGALDETDSGDIEGGGERSENRSSDIEGSSEDR
jgi:hypothetical protein